MFWKSTKTIVSTSTNEINLCFELFRCIGNMLYYISSDQLTTDDYAVRKLLICIMNIKENTAYVNKYWNFEKSLKNIIVFVGCTSIG